MDNLLEKLTAALAGHYVIVRELGSGGMATVYLAEDIRHHRKVAVKVLRPELAISLGPERFLREIDIAAQLQHPNILPLLDSGSVNGLLYYVMPYIEGESLRDRLSREGELPIRDVVRILSEVVDALSLAHHHGVVHRDIKPGNVLLSGRHALVADFGVARAVSEATGQQALTTAGLALGTPTYMAPEQAAADPHVDHRADIYAVGVLAYELLTGRPPFTGASSQAILMAHLTQKPDSLRRDRPAIPPALEQAVLRCLAKRPADRWQNAGELLATLETLETPSGGTTPTGSRAVVTVRRAVPTVVGVATGVVLLAATAAILLRSNHPVAPLTLGHIRQITNAPGLELDPALSHDGKLVAYAAGSVLETHIYVRQIDGGRPVDVNQGLAGSHRSPQWSPDGTQLLFITTLQDTSFVNLAPAFGGATRQLVRVVRPGRRGITSAAWSPDGESIVYGIPGAVMVQKTAGGEPKSIASSGDPHSLNWSPNGSFIAYVEGNSGFVSGPSFGNIAPSSIYVVLASGSTPAAITSGEFQDLSPVWSPDSRSVYFVSNREGRRDLFRVAILQSEEAAAQPERLTTGLATHSVGISRDGKTLVYSALTLQSNVWSVRLPTSGSVSVSDAKPVTFGNRVIEMVDVSPDGRWLAFDSDQSGNAELYRMPLTGGETEQLTNEPADDFAPAWSPDGTEIAFHSLRNGDRDVFVMPAGGGIAQQVTSGSAHDFIPRWSPDGNRLVFQRDSIPPQIYVVEREERGGPWGTPRRLATTGGVNNAIWSVDSRKVLYAVAGALLQVSAFGRQTKTLYRSQVAQKIGCLLNYRGTIVFKARDSQESVGLWSIPQAGGTPQLLIRFDVPGRDSFHPCFDVANGRVYFTVTNNESDIYMAELR